MQTLNWSVKITVFQNVDHQTHGSNIVKS